MFIVFHSFMSLRLQQVSPLKLHKLEVKLASKAELELIPGVGPSMAKKLFGFSGHRLSSIQGIGLKREAYLLKFLKL